MRGVIYVNDTERRRKKLLEQTRNLYQEDIRNPAIHPRYRASYYRLYPEEKGYQKGTLGIRCVICILAFAAYIMAQTSGIPIGEMEEMQVRETITQNYISELY